MKVLVAIEDKLDAIAITEAIHNRSWPSNTEFTLVHVVDVGNEFGERELLDAECPDVELAMTKACRLLLDVANQIKSFMPDCSAQVGVCCGDPKGEILDAIKETQPQVVVIGKHSRSRLLQLFHEDVGAQIVRALPPDVDAAHVVDVPPFKKLVV